MYQLLRIFSCMPFYCFNRFILPMPTIVHSLFAESSHLSSMGRMSKKNKQLNNARANQGSEGKFRQRLGEYLWIIH